MLHHGPLLVIYFAVSQLYSRFNWNSYRACTVHTHYARTRCDRFRDDKTPSEYRYKNSFLALTSAGMSVTFSYVSVTLQVVSDIIARYPKYFSSYKLISLRHIGTFYGHVAL